MKDIELRGEDLLRAVVEGTNANAHLVATNALAWGVAHTQEQYHISEEKVLSAIKFYLDNREEIERRHAENWANAPSHEEQLERFKRMAEERRKNRETN